MRLHTVRTQTVWKVNQTFKMHSTLWNDDENARMLLLLAIFYLFDRFQDSYQHSWNSFHPALNSMWFPVWNALTCALDALSFYLHWQPQETVSHDGKQSLSIPCMYVTKLMRHKPAVVPLLTAVFLLLLWIWNGELPLELTHTKFFTKECHLIKYMEREGEN